MIYENLLFFLLDMPSVTERIGHVWIYPNYTWTRFKWDVYSYMMSAMGWISSRSPLLHIMEMTSLITRHLISITKVCIVLHISIISIISRIIFFLCRVLLKCDYYLIEIKWGGRGGGQGRGQGGGKGRRGRSRREDEGEKEGGEGTKEGRKQNKDKRKVGNEEQMEKEREQT